MNCNIFEEQIETVQQQLKTLQQSAQSPSLKSATEALSYTLEELCIAVEELQEQAEELSAAYESIEAERMRYRELFEFAPDGYLVTDRRGVIQEANGTAATLLNLEWKFLIGKPLGVYVATECRNGFMRQLDQLHQSSGLSQWELRLQRRGGETFPGALAVSPVYDQQKQLLGWRWLIRDLTESHKLKRLAILDGLTKVANRHHFDEILEKEWKRLRRKKLPLALILCDLDRFKNYNDVYGHLKGDECLRQVAQAIHEVVKRPGDLVARYGGEEFVVLLPDTDFAGAVEVTEKIQRALQHLNITHPHSPTSDRLTLSIGIASLIPNQEETSATLVAAADSALYEAKAGRDRYVVFNRETSIASHSG